MGKKRQERTTKIRGEEKRERGGGPRQTLSREKKKEKERVSRELNSKGKTRKQSEKNTAVRVETTIL